MEDERSKTTPDDRAPRLLAGLYNGGRLMVATLIVLGLLSRVTGHGVLSGRALELGLFSLTYLPVIGMGLLGLRWISRRVTDPVGWLALAGAVFLVTTGLLG